MNHRERLLAAIYHEEPDRVPIWINFSIGAYKLYSARYPKIVGEVYNLSDARSVFISAFEWWDHRFRKSFKSLISAGKIKANPDGTFEDEWRVKFKPADATRDWNFLDHPIKTMNDLDEYEWPDPLAPHNLELVHELEKFDSDEYVIMGGIGFSLFERAHILRGFAELLKDTIRNPRFAEKLLDKVTEWDVKLAKEITNEDIDIFILGDDYGTQRGLIFSPAQWRHFIKPRLKRICDIARKKNQLIFLHSDGYLTPIIPDLIEIGINILNPIQPQVMDPALLKQEFGEDLVFCGTIDNQKTLPFGTPEEVRREVLTRISTVGYDGGLLIGPSHDILIEVPPANVIALIETAKKFGRYPQRLDR